ncbi:Acyl carrier protein, mitochondrial [Nakaseomyces bracarensis]|uniref:Acyl carrier protein n=1 Tax=Nakaseomyces bracarensis TaxID=273131 RepID=A0ABR4NT24_9SACH
MFSRIVPRVALTTRVASRSCRPMVMNPLRMYSARSRDDISSQLVNVVKNFVKAEDSSKITADAKFHKDLGLDSLDTVELIVSIEEEFDTEIPDDVADRLTSLQDTIEYLYSQQEK